MRVHTPDRASGHGLTPLDWSPQAQATKHASSGWGESPLDLDDHGADLSRAVDVLDRVGDLIECVGAGDVEFCG